MSRRATQQDYNDFYESLTPKQLKIVKQADELFADFLDERDAKKAFDEWDKEGRPKGMTLEEMENKIKATQCS